jgi:1,4-dihydroxy-2-naphthoate octaprenyltransferase
VSNVGNENVVPSNRRGCIHSQSYFFPVSRSTGGPWPLGYVGLGDLSIAYLGLGDIFVFVYFGLVATLMPPFLYVSSENRNDTLDKVLLKIAPYAVQVATLATNIIIVNNLRDRHTDISANKNTLAVRFGATFCRTEYTLMVAIAYVLVLWDWGNHSYTATRLLPLLSFRLARQELSAIYKKDGGALNPHVGGTAKIQFLFCTLLSIGIRISS